LTESENKLEVIGKEGNDFIVKVPDGETYVKIEDIYAEMFPIVETSSVNSPFIIIKPIERTRIIQFKLLIL
jgi:hypothetical protein